MVLMIGRHIVEFEQGGAACAGYGKRLMPKLAESLTAEFGRGFDERNLRNMRAFFQAFPIWNAVRTELSWTHYRTLLRVENEQARRWYMDETATQNWSSRALDRQIGTLYYERLLASRDREPVEAEARANTVALTSPRELVPDPAGLFATHSARTHGDGKCVPAFRVGAAEQWQQQGIVG